MSVDIALIPISASEKAAFLAMAVDHFRGLNPAFTPLPEWEANYFETILDNPAYRLCWIHRGGEVAGFLLSGVENHRFFPRTIGAIYELYVVPSHRRSGVGKEAARLAIAELFSAGVQRVQLEVIEGNDKAAELWKQLGFGKVSARYTLAAPVRSNT